MTNSIEPNGKCLIYQGNKAPYCDKCYNCIKPSDTEQAFELMVAHVLLQEFDVGDRRYEVFKEMLLVAHRHAITAAEMALLKKLYEVVQTMGDTEQSRYIAGAIVAELKARIRK